LLDNSNTEFHETPTNDLFPHIASRADSRTDIVSAQAFSFPSVNNVMVVVMIMVTDWYLTL
jgi:hypothetical protein